MSWEEELYRNIADVLDSVEKAIGRHVLFKRSLTVLAALIIVMTGVWGAAYTLISRNDKVIADELQIIHDYLNYSSNNSETYLYADVEDY